MCICVYVYVYVGVCPRVCIGMPSQIWSENNQKYLIASVDEIRTLLEENIAQPTITTAATTTPSHYIAEDIKKKKKKKNNKKVIPPEWTEETPPALETICGLFGLSLFERSVLVLCAGIELDAKISQLCAKLQGNSNNTYPTFALALAVLPQPHWSALTPTSPLRHFRLIDFYGPPTSVTTSPLRIEERVLHYLTGISYLERGLRGMLKPVRVNAPIVDSHNRIVEKIVVACNNLKKRLPLIQLLGLDETSKLIIAKKACAKLGLDLWSLPAEVVVRDTKADELQQLFVELWTREAALLGSGLYISAEDTEDAAMQKSITRLVDAVPGPVFLGTQERWPILSGSTTVITLEVNKPKKAEQYQLWKSCLREEKSEGAAEASTLASSYKANDLEISKLVGQFDLSSSAILTAISQALLSPRESDGGSRDGRNDDNLFSILWETSRALTRPHIANLAQRIIPKANMNELVLPLREKQLLREIAIHAAQRDKVYREWGFDAKNNRGLGITALFSGASGTGKTMAAEALANELNLDLFRIDLSTVVSKYIGETEKNLRRVFDAAEDGGAILFFDEADALFGKRSEVKDSHDRYANIEIGYLLQRMESYRGLAILATNMKNTLDTAFIRRIRFTVSFPFPDEKSRAEIWKRIFPSNTPIDDGVDIQRLARLNISGGSIYNIALYASFLAADEGVPVNKDHLKRAAQVEYTKIERPLTQSELGGW